MNFLQFSDQQILDGSKGQKQRSLGHQKADDESACRESIGMSVRER